MHHSASVAESTPLAIRTSHEFKKLLSIEILELYIFGTFWCSLLLRSLPYTSSPVPPLFPVPSPPLPSSLPARPPHFIARPIIRTITSSHLHTHSLAWFCFYRRRHKMKLTIGDVFATIASTRRSSWPRRNGTIRGRRGRGKRNEWKREKEERGKVDIWGWRRRA